MGSWAEADLDMMLRQQTPMTAPPTAWHPPAGVAFDWQPSILVVGRGLSRNDRARVERTGVVEHVATLQNGLKRMEEARWNVIVVSPSIADETDGVRFVRAFKCSTELVGASDSLKQLRDRYQRTPFLVQPLDDDSQFAVFESATRWFLGNTWAVPLAEAILRCATR